MIAAGALFYSIGTKRFLFLLRNNSKTKNTWGLPGGKLNIDESTIIGLNRELLEELGEVPEIIKYIPLETFTSLDNEFRYHSFIFIINNEFIPILNSEHDGYCWTTLEKFPKPLHPGLFNTINISVIKEKIKMIEEM